jgi:hypothetical protein
MRVRDASAVPAVRAPLLGVRRQALSDHQIGLAALAEALARDEPVRRRAATEMLGCESRTGAGGAGARSAERGGIGQWPSRSVWPSSAAAGCRTGTSAPYATNPKARLVAAVDAPAVIPHYYGCYDAPDFQAVNGDPTEVAALMRDGDRRIRVVAPGECVVVRRSAG